MQRARKLYLLTRATIGPAMPSEALVAEIMAVVSLRYIALNRHYEAAWTESWSHHRCEHVHRNLREAAQCAMPHGAGWYVFAVEYGSPRQLTDAEEQSVNEMRFGGSTGAEVSRAHSV